MRSPLVGLAGGAPLSLDEFIITYVLIGGHDTLPIYIYTQVKFGITPEVNALAAMLLVDGFRVAGLPVCMTREEIAQFPSLWTHAPSVRRNAPRR
jgi:ABC-type spermidine/putrescine transport system permease subunit II